MRFERHMWKCRDMHDRSCMFYFAVLFQYGQENLCGMHFTPEKYENQFYKKIDDYAHYADTKHAQSRARTIL